MAGERERDGRRIVTQPFECRRIGHRSAERERTGFVEQRAIDPRQPFERGAVLDHDPAPHQRARRDHLRHRHREPERARASDDQHRNADHQRLVQPRARQHPAPKAQRRQRVDSRRVKPRGAIGDPHVGRLALPGSLHQRGDARQRGAFAGGGDAHFDGAFEVERARQHCIAFACWHGSAFAGQQRLIKAAGTGDDLAVGRQPLARRDAHDEAGVERARGNPRNHAVGGDHGGAGRGLAQQRFHAGTCTIAHRGIERAARQQEQQQHQRAVEPGIGAVGERFVKRQRGGKADPDRDRHVHIGASMPQRGPRRAEERPASNHHRRHSDRGGEQVKQVARRSASARPHADR